VKHVASVCYLKSVDFKSSFSDPCDVLNDSVLHRFGKKVRSLRAAAGLSQEELAGRCGLDRTYIGSVERGERNISLLNICRIAEALAVKPADLLR
jgi:DNA-binding XRE family transcriptional regulator